MQSEMHNGIWGESWQHLCRWVLRWMQSSLCAAQRETSVWYKRRGLSWRAFGTLTLKQLHSWSHRSGLWERTHRFLWQRYGEMGFTSTRRRRGPSSLRYSLDCPTGGGKYSSFFSSVVEENSLRFVGQVRGCRWLKAGGEKGQSLVSAPRMLLCLLY